MHQTDGGNFSDCSYIILNLARGTQISHPEIFSIDEVSMQRGGI